MKYREQRKLLLEAGFAMERQGSRHELWTNGRERVALSHGGNISPNTLQSFKSKMRKAMQQFGQFERGKSHEA